MTLAYEQANERPGKRNEYMRRSWRRAAHEGSDSVFWVSLQTLQASLGNPGCGVVCHFPPPLLCFSPTQTELFLSQGWGLKGEFDPSGPQPDSRLGGQTPSLCSPPVWESAQQRALSSGGTDLWTRGRRGGAGGEKALNVCITVCKSGNSGEFALWPRELRSGPLTAWGGMGRGTRVFP